jgi:tetratricopeptide (TPR) repeat protein
MLLKLRQQVAVVLLGLGLGGCYPAAENGLDEQKNPYYLAGKERVASRDYKGAIEAFEKAIEVNPRSALAHFELGVLYEQRENDYPAAIHHYNRVLKLRPSGDYPAEHARLRIPACKQEMIKTDTLTTINPAALQEFERLRDENQQLRKQIEYLQGQIPSRPPGTPNPAAVGLQPSPGAPPAVRGGPTNVFRSPATPATRRSAPTTAAAPASSRTHKVKASENPASIARQYGVKLESLMAANPGLDARRLKVGQVINIPSS